MSFNTIVTRTYGVAILFMIIACSQLDTKAPEITFLGDDPFIIAHGSTCIYPHAIAIDDRDGNISVTVSGDVNCTKIGTYPIIYHATDTAGNVATKSRMIIVEDQTPPLITLLGEQTVELTLDKEYIDMGVIVTDNVDTNISVDITNDIDIHHIGTYSVTYHAQDKAENKARKIRTIHIQPPLLAQEKLKIDDRVIAIDDKEHRIFFTLGATFQQTKDLNATLSWEGPCGFKINGDTIENGGLYTFPHISFGSEVQIQRYYDNELADEYTLIFSNLPMITLTSIEEIKDEPKTDGMFTLMSLIKDIQTPMGIEIRGGSSQAFDKKAYAIELKKDNNSCKNSNKKKLLDLRKDDDWLLDATYRDTTFSRNIVGHDIFNQMRDHAHSVGPSNKGQAAIKGRLAEVILNGEYNGLYMLEEAVDRKLLELSSIDVKENDCNKYWDEVDWDDPKNGSVLYKGVNHDANFLATCAYDYYGYCEAGEEKRYLWQGFEQKYPKLSEYDRRDPLVELVDFIIHSSNIEFIQKIGSKIDIDNLVDYFLAMMIGNTSDVITKNQYLARSEEGKFFFIPWDWDASFGIQWTGKKNDTWDKWSIEGNGLIKKLYNNTETGFNNKLKERWDTLRESILSNQTIKDKFASYLDQQDRSNAAQRTFERWPTSGHLGAEDREELRSLEYLGSWIDHRMAFLDNKINTLPLATNIVPFPDAGADQRVLSEISVELNATASTDMNGDETIETYQWIQTNGINISLIDANTSTPTFIAPLVNKKEKLSFQVTVTDTDGLSAMDTVNIIVLPRTKVMISEIHYNPADDTDLEFIELYNDEDHDVELDGWEFTKGIEHTFSDVTIPAKEVILLAKDSTKYPSSIQWSSGKLSNKGELLVLKDETGQIIDSVEYDDKHPWPTEADGEGPSLELKADQRNNASNDHGENWMPSSCDGGTPGTL
jgi:spore coat protein CotH